MSDERRLTFGGDAKCMITNPAWGPPEAEKLRGIELQAVWLYPRKGRIK